MTIQRPNSIVNHEHALKHIEQLIQIARDAGHAILGIYDTEYVIVNKEDHSPLTDADRASHEVIMQGLRELDPTIPVMSEEGSHTSYEERQDWRIFWLVDPLDGTKEFIKKNGEFTVNLALIEGNYPIFGLIHVPVTGMTYVGTPSGAYLLDSNNQRTDIHVTAPRDHEITIVESRSHPSPEGELWMASLQRSYATIHRIEKGSSLKLCAVADGSAHVYPRLGPTMEWDIAAGQAIIEAAGGQVVDLQGQRFAYNKENLLNGHFIACGNLDLNQV